MRERKFVKLRVDMYEDTKFKIIDRMDQRDLIHYIWTRLVTLTGKVNLGGDLFLSKNIPYTLETLAIEFNREVSQVELAIKTFIKLEMVELTEDNIYRVKNFAKHQNIKIEEKAKPEDKIETKSKPSEDKSVDSKAKNEEQLKDNCEAAVDLNDNVISLSNSIANESIKAIGSTSSTNNMSNTNIDSLKGVITDKVQNIDDVNKINCIDKTVKSEIDTRRIQGENSKHNILEQAGKNTNKNKRKNNKVTNEINVQDDDGEIIELQNGERQLEKEERIVDLCKLWYNNC